MPGEAKDAKVMFAKKETWSWSKHHVPVKLCRFHIYNDQTSKKKSRKLRMNGEFSKISKLTTIILVSAYCTLALASDHLPGKVMLRKSMKWTSKLEKQNLTNIGGNVTPIQYTSFQLWKLFMDLINFKLYVEYIVWFDHWESLTLY